MSDETKAIVTVSEMARMCGLSRARFYQLQKAGIFPPPLYDVETRRPIYDEELQKVCLEVRRRNCGVNGKPILFYARRVPLTPIPAKPKKVTTPSATSKENADLIENVKAFGLETVTAAQVTAAMRKKFPQGTSGIPQLEVAKAIFLHLMGRD